MDYLFYARVVRKRWRHIVLAVLICVAAAAYATSKATPTYRTQVKFYISGQTTDDVNAAINSALLSQQRVKSYANLVTSGPIVTRVLETVGPVGGGEQPQVRAETITDTALMVVSVTGSDPSRVQAVANGYGKVLPELVDELERPVDGGATPVKATLVEPAALPLEPVSPDKTRNMVVATLLGLLVGAAAALLAEILDTSIKSTRDLSDAAEAPVLGVLAQDDDVPKQPLTVHVEPMSRRAEAFRQLRTNIQFADVDKAQRTLVVTSATSEEGKSFVSCNLAIAMAQAGERVVLVEADLRRPAVSTYMGIEGSRGLTDVLIHRATLEDVLQDWQGGLLRVLPGGQLPPNPSEMLGSQAMVAVLEQLAGMADVVVLDSPPLLPVTDAAVLAVHTDGVLLVARAGATSRDQVRRAADALRQVGAHVTGTVLNRTPVKGPDAYVYSYDGYYSPDVERDPEMRPDAPARRLRGRTAEAPAERPRRRKEDRRDDYDTRLTEAVVAGVNRPGRWRRVGQSDGDGRAARSAPVRISAPPPAVPAVTAPAGEPRGTAARERGGAPPTDGETTPVPAAAGQERATAPPQAGPSQ